MQMKYVCACYANICIKVHSCTYFIYKCVCIWMYMHTHIPKCILLPWCWVPCCWHFFRNFQYWSSDSIQPFLLFLRGRLRQASALRTSVRQHCTCSQQAAPLRFPDLHPTGAVIKENRYLRVGEASGCCMVCRQRKHLQPACETRAGERWCCATVPGWQSSPLRSFCSKVQDSHLVPSGTWKKREKRMESGRNPGSLV